MTRWVLLLSISVLAIGCGKPQPRAPEQVAREATEQKEPEFFDELRMTQAQREKVLALIDQLYVDFAEYDRTRLVLLDATIEQIQAGQLDREELLPLAEVTIAEFEKALPNGIAAMQRLHDILTRQQREELVALFTEGRKLSDEERREARNNKIAKVLGLTTGQKAKIYPALFALYIKHWGTISRFRSALHEAQDAFVEDRLVAKDLAVAKELELMAIGEVIFDALEIGMNNLSREQHATLAALLDSQLRSPNPTKTEGTELPPSAESDAEKPPDPIPALEGEGLPQAESNDPESNEEPPHTDGEPVVSQDSDGAVTPEPSVEAEPEKTDAD